MKDMEAAAEGGFEKAPREMHDATCAECGKTCQVPFKPDGSRPVHCSDCYQKHSTKHCLRIEDTRRGQKGFIII